MSTVLIVDDNRAFNHGLALALKDRGYHVLASETLGEAYGLVSEADVVLLDVMMPDGNGLDFVDEIRARANLVPIIVISGCPDVRHEAERRPISYFLEKPLDLPFLTRRIEDAVRTGRALEDYRTRDDQILNHCRRIEKFLEGA